MKQVVIFITISVVFIFSACSKKQDAPQILAEKNNSAYHIGILTSTFAQSAEELLGAERLITEYGDEANGGIIKHLTYPDNFSSEKETVINQIVSFADDSLMKAIIVNQSIPGTVDAFKIIREKRPDILLFSGETQEKHSDIQQVADLAISSDFIKRGFLIVWSAKQLGAKTFVHVSFNRHMKIESMLRRRLIMEAACKDLGLKFVFENAPDPTSNVGQAGAQQFILEKVPAWIKKYGKQSAFFCTNDAHTEPLIKQVLNYGGYFIEADIPSPLLGYPGALDIDISKEKSDFPSVMKMIEKAVIDAGGAGRFGTWSYSYGYTNTAGLGELAKNIIDKKVSLKEIQEGNLKPLLAAYNKFTPGANWNGDFYFDAVSSKKANNHVLIYQDTYIFGKGYLNSTSQVIPDKYSTIK